MKLKIEFSKNTEPVPFEYMSKVNGYLHKVLGDNNEFHDEISLYSTSFLHGGKFNKNINMLNFPNGAVWYVSSNNDKFITDFIKNIYNHVDLAYGMKLENVNAINNDLISDGNLYLMYTKSPILLKQKDFNTGKNSYYTYEDDVNVTTELMKNIILKKASKVNFKINENDFDIMFNKNYEKSKIKWIKIKSISNKTSICPIILKTDRKDIVDFIYNVGVGHSTGSGFGFLL